MPVPAISQRYAEIWAGQCPVTAYVFQTELGVRIGAIPHPKT